MSGDYSADERVITWNSNAKTYGDVVDTSSVSVAVATIPASGDLCFPADFTVEIFGATFNSNSTKHGVIGIYEASGNQRSWSLTVDGTVSPKVLQMVLSSDGSAGAGKLHSKTTPWAFSANTPYDICLERTDDVLRAYIDGTQLYKETLVFGYDALKVSSAALGIARGYESINGWKGTFKAIRLTAAARYKTDGSYSVPSLPLPTKKT